jgi:hypothetical protein
MTTPTVPPDIVAGGPQCSCASAAASCLIGNALSCSTVNPLINGFRSTRA